MSRGVYPLGALTASARKKFHRSQGDHVPTEGVNPSAPECRRVAASSSRRLVEIALAIALTIAAVPATAQDRDERPIVSKEDPRPIVRVNLQPAAVPNPPLKYPLLPPYLEQTEGNAAPLYYRAMLLWEMTRRNEPHRLPEAEASLWLDVPLNDFPMEKARATLRRAEYILTELHGGARRERCDWDLPLRGNRDVIRVHSADVQVSRSLARLLALQARVALRDGDHQAAIRAIQTGYAFARHLSEAPWMMSAIVGTADAWIISQAVEDMRELPGSPNLYWSLTALPRPFIDMRKAFEAEFVQAHQMFPAFREARTASHTDAEWQRLFEAEVRRYGGMFRRDRGGDDTARAPLQDKATLALLAIQHYPTAKERLIERGWAPEEVERMPAARVLMIDIADTYDELTQNIVKWLHVPYWQAAGHPERSNDLKRAALSYGNAFSLSELIPAFDAFRVAGLRLDRQIAEMRLIEALRHYAATHDGRLPATLDDIEDLPIPTDPFTGEPFEYRLDGETAVIDVRPPVQRHAQDGKRYEVTIAK
ncbi:MAG: hypothetical protein WD066_10245 [Planctomycetaceae bacterium]